MFISRQVGKILRGKATPLQLFMACVLGGIAGFVPGVRQAPGLILALFVLLAVLNANLLVAGLVAGAGQFVNLFLTPLTFTIGQALLDGPMQPFFKRAINAPGSALLGLEYYVTTGGIAIGLAYGLVCAVILIAIVGRFRRMMLKIEEGSPTYQKYAKRGWVRAIGWLVFGKKGKKTYAEMMKRRFGLPIRPLGVLLVAGVLALAWVGRQFVSDTILTEALRGGLERANGATVDIQRVSVDFSSGALRVEGLAIADANRLDRDAFRAASLEGNLSGRDLLRARFTIDEVRVENAESGSVRARPGVIVGTRRRPKPPTEGKTLDDYLRDFETWKARLEQVERWIEEVAKRIPDSEPKDSSDESLRDRIRREIEERGYRRVKATHLMEGSPTVLIKRITIDGVKVDALPGDPVDVVLTNLSTQPWLWKGVPTADIRAASGDFVLALAVGSIAGREAGAQAPEDHVEFLRRGLPGTWVQQQLKVADPPLIAGGIVDLSLAGPMRLGDGVRLALDLGVTIRGADINVPGVGGTRVEEMSLPIGIAGRLSAPAITVDGEKLADALVEAGKAELASRVRAEADKELGKITDDLKNRLGDQVPGVGDLIDGTLNEGLDGLFGKKPKKPE
ncbi:MAG: hypothetical protein IT439_00150 [Phycisphaerales bacterium]|nr:hypothetical protein [Phycisphaerales bacterium]